LTRLITIGKVVSTMDLHWRLVGNGLFDGYHGFIEHARPENDGPSPPLPVGGLIIQDLKCRNMKMEDIVFDSLRIAVLTKCLTAVKIFIRLINY